MFLDLVEKLKGSPSAPAHEPEPAPVGNSPSPAPALQPPVVVPRTSSTASASPSTSDTAGHSVLGRDVEVIGSIRFAHSLVIDGRVDGDVCSDGILTVGEHAVVKGQIKTRAAIILGKVEGNITLQDRCELRSTATLIGDIAAGTLTIEEGASFTGQSRIGKHRNAGSSAPDRAEKPLEVLPKKSPESTPAQAQEENPLRKAA